VHDVVGGFHRDAAAVQDGVRVLMGVPHGIPLSFLPRCSRWSDAPAGGAGTAGRVTRTAGARAAGGRSRERVGAGVEVRLGEDAGPEARLPQGGEGPGQVPGALPGPAEVE